MSENNPHRQFLPEDNLDRDRIVIDVPPAPAFTYIECVPKRSDAMGRIYLTNDISHQRITGGQIPRGMLVIAWYIVGLLLFVKLLPRLPAIVVVVLFLVVVVLAPLLILWQEKGTKRSAVRNRTQC